MTGYPALAVDIENAGATFVDEPAVVDGPLVTARVPDDLPAFLSATFETPGVDAEPARAAPTA